MDKSNFSNIIIIGLFFLFLPTAANAGDKIDRATIELSTGYRQDSLDWNQSGSGGSPNILSELSWDNLQSYQISAKGKLDWSNDKIFFGAALRTNIDYGFIFSGKNQDSDYGGDNRSAEFLRSNNNADDGHVYDFSIAIGPTFFRQNYHFQLTPLLGYSYHQQNLTMSDGYYTIYAISPYATGTFPGLDSSYDSTWKGFWLGAEVEYSLNDNLSFHSLIEFHDADYNADANWNLRTDLAHPVSFTNNSDSASGIVTNLGVEYNLARYIQLNLDMDYQQWQAIDGIRYQYNSSGTTSTLALNEVNWQSYSLMIGAIFRY